MKTIEINEVAIALVDTLHQYALTYRSGDMTKHPKTAEFLSSEKIDGNKSH